MFVGSLVSLVFSERLGYVTQEISEIDDVSIQVFMNETIVEFTLTGPSDRWFGIGIGGSHTNGDGLFYTTGSTDSESLYAYDCILRDKTKSMSTSNGLDTTTQDWTIHSLEDDGTHVTIIATRLLDTGDSDDYAFEYPPDSESFYFAHGTTSSDYQLAYHSSNKGSTNIAFTSSLGMFLSLKSIHAVCSFFVI